MDIYKISIALAMSSNHAAVLSALTQQLLHVHTNVGQLTGGFNRLKLAIGGAFAVGAGIALLDVTKKLIHNTKEYQDELVKIQNLGGAMGASVTSGQFDKDVFAMSKTSKLSVTDLAKIQGNLNSLVGPEKAKELWQPLADYEWVAQFRDGYSGDAGKSMTKVLRAGELSGRVTDPITTEAGVKQTKEWLDLVTRIVSATHGTVNETTLLGLANQMGAFGRGLSEEGFMTQAIMAQAMGGQRAGTAFMSTYQQMATGAMFARTAGAMERGGLLRSDEWRTDHGRVIIDDPKVLHRLTSLVNKDPLKLAAMIDKQLTAMGITDIEERMRMVSEMFGRQTSQRYNAEQQANYKQMINEREIMKQGLGVAGSKKNIDAGSITANEQALANAWTNLQVAIAGPNSENVIYVLQSLTRVINDMKETVRGMDPKTIVDIGKGIAALGVGLAGAGGIALLAALGPTGWFIAAMAALGTYAAAHKDTSGKQDPVGQYVTWIEQKIAAAWPTITEVLGGMGNAIANACGIAGNLINSAFDFLVKVIEKLGDGISWVIKKISGLMPEMGWGPIRDESGKIKDPGKYDKSFWDAVPKPNIGASREQFDAPDYDANGNATGMPVPKAQSFIFNPETRAVPYLQPINLSLQIDGRTLAQATSWAQSESLLFPTGAPASDGQAIWNPPDHNRAR